MAIAPISSVSFRNNYNHVNFEGRRKDDEQHSSGMSNTIKAIPLAAVIAMSPLCDAYAQNNDEFPDCNLKKELYNELNSNDKLIGGTGFISGLVPWAGQPVKTDIGFYDCDGNSSDYEKMIIDTYTGSNWKYPDRIYVRNFVIRSTYNTDTKETKNEYLIEGLRTRTRKKQDGTDYEKQRPGMSTLVNKKVFDVLKERLGDSMVIKVEKRTTNNEIEDSGDINTGIMMGTM